MDIEMDPANDLFQLSDPEADEDEPVEEIYHLTLQHFYPARSVALLQRSMGLPLDPPWEPPPQELKKFEVSYSRHDELGAAGSLRNYIILGCRPTYPFTVISFVRQRTDNPYDVWHWVYPQGPYPTATGSIVHWDVDIAKELLHPRLPPTPSTLPQESAYNRVTDNMVLTLMCSAWDLRRDEFVQISMWTDPEGQDKRGYALSYGEVTGGIRTTAREGTTICLCGCGMSAKEDVHIKFTVPSAIVFWFPYQKKVIPEGAGHIRYVGSGSRSRNFVYIDLRAFTESELKKRLAMDTTAKLLALGLEVLGSKQPYTSMSPKEQAALPATLHVLFRCIDWTSRKLYSANYQINALDLSVEILDLRVQTKQAPMWHRHHHDCLGASWKLPIKYYPRWRIVHNSMPNMVLEELGLELELGG